jgi:hypothetical protein
MKLGKKVVNYYIRTHSLFNITINPDLKEYLYPSFVRVINDNVLNVRNSTYINLYIIWF